MSSSLPRRLAVILHADVVGSTTLVQRDEAVAHERIRDAFVRFSHTIEAYGGVTLELRGDALLAEFGRASDAVSAALSFQLASATFADDTVTGAGVVLAQRLEQLAPAGGVVVQGAVSETVPTRLPFDYENLGEQALKGF
jgi:class 3 adenylate cyclase